MSFTAHATDPDSDSVVLSWAAPPGKCDPLIGDSSGWPQGMRADIFSVPEQLTDGPFCVWAFATDRHGAVGVDARTFSPTDAPPLAMIDLAAPSPMPSYRLYTTFRLDGRRSADPDGDLITDYQWTLESPTMTIPFTTCDGGDIPDARCFRADRPGAYKVWLKVVAGDGPSGPAASLPLNVLYDTPPCIEETTPAYGTSFVPVDPNQIAADPTFTVDKVEDDGDGYPSANGNPTFTWYRTLRDDPPGTPATLLDHPYRQLMIPKSEALVGNTMIVTVEVRDRRVGPVDQLADCGDALSCHTIDPITGEICYQRVSWTVHWQ